MAWVTTFEDARGGGKTVEVVADGVLVGGAIHLPADPVSLTMLPAGGSSKVQYTRSPISKVLANTAVWYDLFAAAAVVTHSVATGMSAIRLNVASGTCVLEVRLPY